MENTARLYNCAQCHIQVIICRHCDRGNIYCNDCAPVARVDAQRKAGERYQLSKQGRTKHAARQRLYRQRLRKKVTHQGSLRLSLRDLLQERSEIRVVGKKSSHIIQHDDISCHSCRLEVSPFVRLGYLRSG